MSTFKAAHYNPSAASFASSLLSGHEDDDTITMSTSYVDSSGSVQPLYNPTASAIQSAHAFMDSYLAQYGADSFQSVISNSSALTSLLIKRGGRQ